MRALLLAENECILFIIYASYGTLAMLKNYVECSNIGFSV